MDPKPAETCFEAEQTHTHLGKCTAWSFGTRFHHQKGPRPLYTGPLGTAKVVISLRTSLKNKQSKEAAKNGGSPKYPNVKLPPKDTRRPPRTPKRRLKSAPKTPRKAAHATSEVAKRMTRGSTINKNQKKCDSETKNDT